MTSRALALLAACAAALLACRDRAVTAEDRRAAGDPGRAGAAARDAGGAAERPGASGRGDRHARAAARHARPVKRVDGTVARTGDRQVVIQRRGAPELSLRVTPDAAVTIDGKPARLEDVPEGAEVRAAYRTGNGGRPTALSLEARSGKAGRR
jgi:hypothetical protein